MEIKKKIVELDLNDVLPNRFQPRLKFDENHLEELSNSIKQHGVIQPIIVRRLGDKFEIIAGERRFKASVMADMKTIPAIVTEMNDKESSEIALIENVQRSDLTPIEEAISYKKILDMNYFTQEELAAKLGKTQSTVANKLRLLHLDDEVQEALLDMKISERHARSLLKIKDTKQQRELLMRIINERLTVRRTDEEIDKMLKDNEIEFLSFGEQQDTIPEVKETTINNDSDMPSIGIIESQTEAIPEIGGDMLYNQATMDIPGLVGMESPVTPIEDIAPIASFDVPVSVEPLAEIPTPIDNSINPGFMNIDEIENNAKDLFTEKPIRPLTSFLEPVEELSVAPLEQIETEATNAQKASFINPNFVPSEEEEVVTAAPVQTNGAMFDFNFEEVNDMQKPEVKIPELSGLGSIKDFEPKATEENLSVDIKETPIVEENAEVVETTQPEEEIETLSLTGEIPVITPALESSVETNPALETTSFESQPETAAAAVMEEPAEIVLEPKEKKGFFGALRDAFGGDNNNTEETPTIEQAPVLNDAIITPEPESNEEANPFIDETSFESLSDISEISDNSMFEVAQPEEEIETLSLTGEIPVITPALEESIVEPAMEINMEQPFELPVLEENINIEPLAIGTEVPMFEEAALELPVIEEQSAGEILDISLPIEETIEISPVVEELAANPEPTNMFDNSEELISEQPLINNIEEPLVTSNFDLPFENVLDSVELPAVEENVTEPIEVNDIVEPIVEESSDEEEGAAFETVSFATLPIDEEEENTFEDLTVPFVPQMETNTTNSKDIGAAMQIIKNCAEQLKEIGFAVDTEEFDFEDIYQVIIKINKN